MAVISTDSFDPLRRYVSVRMQQGVPLVDRDWNEREDARRFEVRNALRWFAADGVGLEKDAFRIDGTGVANDFTIRSGAPAAPNGLAAGRALANGGGALIAQDATFRGQSLHVAQGAAATALAAKLGVPTIPELAAGPGTLLVYLDIWERYVPPAEDGALVLPGLGVESCGRLKREWAVRVVAGTALPVPPAGHDYLELARIQRGAAAAVSAADVTDRRERRLWAWPAIGLVDAFGTAGVSDSATIAAYRRGANRPPISYRDAINALLLGHLPGSQDVELAVTAGQEAPLRPIADGNGNLVAPLVSNRANPGSPDPDLYLVGASLSDADSGFAAPVQVTSGLKIASAPQLLQLAPNDLVLVYVVTSTRVAYRRGAYPGLASAAEEPAVAAGDYEGAVVGATGTTAIFVFLDKAAGHWVYRRRNLTTGAYLDAVPATFLPTAATDGQAGIPALDSAGNLWFAVAVTSGVQARSIDATGAGSSSPVFSGSGAGTIEFPSVVVDPNGEVWVFYDEFSTGLWFANLRAGTWTQGFLPGSQPHDGFAQAVVDPAGYGFWLTWQRMLGSGAPARPATYLRFYNARTRAWGPPRALTTTTKRDAFPSPYLEPSGALWVVWNRTAASFTTTRAYVKRVFTRV